MTEPYYASGEHLRAKHRLAQAESGRSFPHWALDRVPLRADASYLDAGAGWGRFTWAMVDDYGIRPDCVVMSDYSTGMLRTADEEAARRRIGRSMKRCAADIATLPFRSRRFDGVLANHVLYHVVDLRRGICELARVLRPDGWLLATTNSDAVRVPVIELHYQALDALNIAYAPEPSSPFSFENGAAFLQTSFREVRIHVFEDKVTYADADAFAAVYATTGRYRNVLASPRVPEATKGQLLSTFRRLTADVIRDEGMLRAPGKMCAFVCTEPYEAS